MAAEKGQGELAGRLIEAGASVNLQDKVRRAGRDGQGGRVWLEGRRGGCIFCVLHAIEVVLEPVPVMRILVSRTMATEMVTGIGIGIGIVAPPPP